ncbi:MAG TPA: peptidylprolyl isomerase, partial [Polyangia bacterium]
KATELDERTRAILACKLAMAHDRAVGRVELLRTCGASERERGVWTAEALVDAGGPELAKLAASPHAAVREAAAEGADAATTKRLLADGDAPVVAAAAERAEKLKLADAASEIAAALARVRGPDAVEAQQALLSAAAALELKAAIPAARALVDAEPYALRQAAAHALSTLEGRTIVARPPSPPPRSSGPAPKLPPTTVRLRTTRGIIRARLWVDDAPRTAANFIALARKRFYDKLTFHRVVPDFVSQGGDPRGDGAGGPGYMIPCEIGMRRYGEGVLGMALSGRDTGGSQFFFTQAPAPHLDGRYTAFGEVLSGLDVVDTLVEGDVILELTVE